MMGCYGPIVIDPVQPLPDMRGHVLLFSDHSFVNPARIARNLKVSPITTTVRARRSRA
jgi:hypothetical protein